MKISCLLLYSTFQMTPKTLKYVNYEKQDNFSRKHENTLKSMEFYKRDEYFCPPSVCTINMTNVQIAFDMMNMQIDEPSSTFTF